MPVKLSYLDKPITVFKLWVVDPYWFGSTEFLPQADEYKTDFFISLQKIHYPFVVFNPLYLHLNCHVSFSLKMWAHMERAQSWKCAAFWAEVDK